MSFEINRLGTDPIEWDTFVRTSDEGTPFHLTARQRDIETYGLRAH